MLYLLVIISTPLIVVHLSKCWANALQSLLNTSPWLTFTHSKLQPNVDVLLPWKRLGEDVKELFISSAVLQGYYTIYDEAVYEVETNINVFCVAMQSGNSSPQFHNPLEFSLTTLLSMQQRWQKYTQPLLLREQQFLVFLSIKLLHPSYSKQHTQCAFLVQQRTTRLPSIWALYLGPNVVVPAKYLMMRFTALRWCWERLFMNLDRKLTEYVMSGRVWVR